MRLVGRIVVFAELVQNDPRAVVELDFVVCPFVIIRLDVFIGRDKVDFVNRVEVPLSVLKTLG